jgi:hypothetical protein
MATTVGTTSVEVATSLRTTYTTPLLAQIASGNTVQAAHMTLLKGFINAIESHTHTLTDFSQIKEFGNTNATASAAETVIAVVSTPVASTYTAGSQITSAQYTEMRTVVEAHRVHNHVWDDTIV